MNAETLMQRLTTLGIAGTLEARGTLALLVLDDIQIIRDPVVRAAAVAVATECGFTHLALSLDDDNGAPLPRA